MIDSYFVVIFFTLLSNLLGFAKEILVAASFGISGELDIFLLAFAFINIFYLIFASGPLQGAFVPTFLKKYNQAPEMGWQYTLSIVTGLSLLSIALGILVVVLTGIDPLMTGFIAPGFNSVQVETFKEFVYILLIYLLFGNISAVLISLLQAINRYAVSCLPPILNNVVIIIVIYLFSVKYKIYSLVVATVLGCLAGLAAQLLYLAFYIEKPVIKWRVSFRDMQAFFFCILPMIGLVLVDQVDAIAQKSILSLTGEGHISLLNYSYKLVSIPIGLLGGSIAVVAFPAIANLLSTQKQAKLISEKIVNAANFLTFALVPTTVFIVLFSLPIVRLFFERGQFDFRSSSAVAEGLLFYSFGILPQSLLVLYNRVFFAYGDSVTPLKIGFVSAVIHITLCFYFAKTWSFLGIAVAASLYALIYFGLLYAFLHKKWIEQEHGVLIKQLAVVTTASGIAGLVTKFSAEYIHYFGKAAVLVSGCEFFAAYILLSFLFRIRETQLIVDFLAAKLRKSRLS